MRRLIATLALLLAATGANAQTAGQSQTDALTDLGSTAIGLALGAAEANHVGLLTIPLKFVLIDQADKLPDGEKQHAHSVIGSLWHGATVNNLCVVAAIATGGAFAPACLVAGVVAGVHRWQSTSMEREFWALCANLRTEAPELKCVFNG